MKSEGVGLSPLCRAACARLIILLALAAGVGLRGAFLADSGRAGLTVETRLRRGLPEAQTKVFRDIDHDGTPELFTGEGVFTWSAKEDRWVATDFVLPAGWVLTDEHDRGWRFADLNGDGVEDLLQSDSSGYRVFLWAGTVNANLGWKRGWPQLTTEGAAGPEAKIMPFVRDGRDTGATFERNAIIWPGDEAAGRAEVRRSYASIIAFQMPEPRSPEASLAAMRPADGFEVELVAAEPLVSGPVAFDWDAQGRLWVVEMPDYPQGMDGKGRPGGVLKFITDTDGNGSYDLATTVLEELSFPTGLAPWRDGVMVASSTDILFVSNFGADGRPRDRRVLFTGFKEGNQQHRQNGYEWGLDGWYYGANGDSGGTINGINISGRDFRFRPDTGEFEAESGQTQYGRHRDDWGNWFGNNNARWLWHYTLEERYLRRNPQLAVKSTRQMLAQYADSTRVFPVSELPVRFNQPQALGHLTSGCSPVPYRDALFGPDFAASIFICEPVHNLIHREVLEPSGATFTSRRAASEQSSEFLASTDPWFRPVFQKTGPDGALYVADFYRFVLEHPEWISPETLGRMNVRAGAERGRIYRVFPRGIKLRATPNLAALSNRDLAAALDSPNGWQRDTAQRLLSERGARETAPVVRQIVVHALDPKVRLQALATLGTLEMIDRETVVAALSDVHPAVRRHALRESEKFSDSEEMLFAVLARKDDPDPAVGLQLAFTLGAFHAERASATLAELADRVGTNELLRIAVLSSSPPESAIAAKLNAAVATSTVVLNGARPSPSTPDRAKVIADYTGVTALPGDGVRGHAVFLRVCAICHRLKNEGAEVGPELGMVSDKPVDWLLTAIFDPSAAIEERYRAQILTLKSGTEIMGIVSAETSNNLVLRLPGGGEVPILRADLTSAHMVPKSLMPDGLESSLKRQDVADLIAWLRIR